MERAGPALALLGGVVAFLLARLLWVLRFEVGQPCKRRRPLQSLRTLVVLGSGGHTAEMLNLLAALDTQTRYCPRVYVAGATDKMSLKRAQAFEESQGHSGGAEYLSIYRSREVGQSYVTSVLTTLLATAHAIWLVAAIQPALVLCNGPGTCLPICVMGFILRFLGRKRVILVYVESVARVQKLSLTGLILHRLRIADQFIVQWPSLVKKYPGTLYLGLIFVASPPSFVQSTEPQRIGSTTSRLHNCWGAMALAIGLTGVGDCQGEQFLLPRKSKDLQGISLSGKAEALIAEVADSFAGTIATHSKSSGCMTI